MKKKMFIVCSVFALIISCKNYASGEDLENSVKNVKQQVKGFKQGIEKKVKQGIEKQIKKFLDKEEKIISDDPTVYEIAEKLKEEEIKEKKENRKDFNLEEKENPKNDLKDNEDVKVLKPEPITLENKEPKLEIAETLKPKLPEIPKLPIVAKSVVKEKTEEEKAKEKREEDLKRRRREKYAEELKKMEERKKQREERRKLRELESGESFLEKVTTIKIVEIARKIDKITSDIDSINPKSYFEERTEVSGKEVEDKVTGAIYDDFTANTGSGEHTYYSSSHGHSLYYEWSNFLEDDEKLYKFLKEELESARKGLRAKIKIKEGNIEKNKDIVKVSDIKGDLEKIKDKLKELKEYLQSNANKEELKKVIKCVIDPDNSDCGLSDSDYINIRRRV
ncbi:hypothetical protein QIA34_06435 (plasmid) [Borreliella yangtzensis]|uniref:DNA repair exonuclease SbcCD ATPase subunit n=1 Tax=Borreliella yangtzensis TaxID=683292 RepID=A0ABR6PBK4_9SPIR|nr:DNA repair exonuclease SbcCD ATPase subunit [Borreliella yangtzensis]